MTKRENEMGEHSFDELAKGVADGTIARSKALQAGGAAILGGLLSIFALPSRDADAARRRPLKTLFAIVKADGTLVKGKGAEASRKTAFTGAYVVRFNRDVSNCSYGATTTGGRTGQTCVDFYPADSVNSVVVDTARSDGTPTDFAFHLQVLC